MGYNITKNTRTGGENCTFTFNGTTYYADKSPVDSWKGIIDETMIFLVEKDGAINWSELYCDTSGKSLKECIEEFTSNPIPEPYVSPADKEIEYTEEEIKAMEEYFANSQDPFDDYGFEDFEWPDDE